MRNLLSFIILPILLVSTSAATAAEITADAAITAVIVYPDRAMVTRAAELELAVGEHTVTFENLPANIDTDSLRTKGDGEARVRIFSIESKKIVLERPREEQIAQLEVEIQSVRDQIAAADARIGDLGAEGELVRSIGVYAGQQFSKEFITRQPQPGEWDAMVRFQSQNLARLSKQTQETEILKRDLNRRLDALVRELQELRGQSTLAGQRVSVTLSALTPGRFRLMLTCVVYGAGWYPSYDARADVQGEQVEITYLGNVRQNTGEDWRTVDVSLSTARPAVGAKMPEISPWYLRPRPPERYEAEAFMDKAMPARKLEAQIAGIPAEMAVAQVVQRGTSVQFKILRKMDVPSDNAYHRATILTRELPAKLSYTTTPRLSQFVYLTAKLTNTTGVQWLPGKVSVFVDGDYIGTSGIEPVAPNEEIDLDLGIDEGIKVEREELVRKEDETRIFGKKKERRFKDKITIQNHKPRPVNLMVIDQVPVAQHEDIKVEEVKFSEKPSEHDPDKGIIKWNLSLAPGEKKEIIIEFTVIHPLDMPVTGL